MGARSPLVRDLGVAYAARAVGRGCRRGRWPVQYIEYVVAAGAVRDLDDPGMVDRCAVGVLGSRRWRGWLSGWCCPRIGRNPVVADYPPRWRWSGLLRAGVDRAGLAGSTTRPLSWWCRRRWRCCSAPIGGTGCICLRFPTIIAGFRDDRSGFFASDVGVAVGSGWGSTVAEMFPGRSPVW